MSTKGVGRRRRTAFGWVGRIGCGRMPARSVRPPPNWRIVCEGIEMAHLIPLGFRRGSEPEETRRLSRTPDHRGRRDRYRTAPSCRARKPHAGHDRVRGCSGASPACERCGPHRRRALHQDPADRRDPVRRWTPSGPPPRPIRSASAPGRCARGFQRATSTSHPNRSFWPSLGTHDLKVVAARTLLSRPRVMREPVDQVAYFRLDLGAKATILAEKTPVVIEAPKSPGS